MVQVGLLLTNKYRLLSVAAILDVFDTVNSHYENNGEAPFFKINLIRNGSSAYEGASFEKYSPLS
jgi:hypothetical protein